MSATQAHPEWCWAACAQMIRRFHGEQVDQSQIAGSANGGEGDQTAAFSDLLVALSPDVKRDWSKLLRQRQIRITPKYAVEGLFQRAKSLRSDDIVTEIADGHPVVLAVRDPANPSGGHAVVAYAVEYRMPLPNILSTILLGKKSAKKSSGAVEDLLTPDQFEIQKVDIFDPWPGVGARSLTGDQLETDLDFVLSRDRAREILQTELKVIQ